MRAVDQGGQTGRRVVGEHWLPTRAVQSGEKRQNGLLRATKDLTIDEMEDAPSHGVAGKPA